VISHIKRMIDEIFELINEELKCSPNSRIVHVYQGLDTNEGIMIIIHYTNDGSGKER